MSKSKGWALGSVVGLLLVACSGDTASNKHDGGGGASGEGGDLLAGKAGHATGGSNLTANPGGAGPANGAETGLAGEQGLGGAGGSPAEPDPQTGGAQSGGAGVGGDGCIPTQVLLPTVLDPVDIIFVVDNSPSMAATVAQFSASLNGFATQLAAKQLDYKLIALSVRAKTNPVTINASSRYGICVPQPLAGDDACGNGTRFFQSEVNVTSRELLEQVLGTLGQTTGYTAADSRGGPAWKAQLRPHSTRHIVVVTDDNARLSANDFESFAGGPNPFNANLTLPPGLRNSNAIADFEGYHFHGVYGWGSAADPTATCTYANNSKPAASGSVYTELVGKTAGVRAKICDGASAWGPFFDALVGSIEQTTRVACAFPVPDVRFQVEWLQLQVDAGEKQLKFYAEPSPADCGSGPVFFYDDYDDPTRIFLCSDSCRKVNAALGFGKSGTISTVVQCVD